MAYKAQGDNERARQCFQKATRVTRDMVAATVARLKSENIEFVVAPFEADPQASPFGPLLPRPPLAPHALTSSQR